MLFTRTRSLSINEKLRLIYIFSNVDWAYGLIFIYVTSILSSFSPITLLFLLYM